MRKQDRDSRFVAKFWSSLWELMDTRLKKSTAFHPQTDSQTEAVQEQLERSQAKYKARHDKHRIEHSFQVGDHIYSVVNAENLRLFEPSLIEDPEEQSQLPSIDDLLLEYLNELQEDTVLDRKVRTMRRGDVEYLRIELKASKPSSARWIEIGQVRTLYPHLIDA
eukprot:PITA_06756